MNLYPTTPQSIGKVLDSGFTLYRNILKPALPLSILVALLAQLPGLMPYVMGGAAAGMGPMGWVIATVGFVAWFVIYLALYNGWVISTNESAQGRAALTAGQAFSAGLPKLLSTLGAFFLFMLAIMGGTLLLVIPGVILMVSLFFFMYFIVLENQRALESLKSSRQLVKGHWWRTMTVMSVGGAIYMVAVLVVTGLAATVLGVSMSGEPKAEAVANGLGIAVVIYTLVQVVVNAVLMPMWNALMLVQFRDLQLRKSGADLAARAAAA